MSTYSPHDLLKLWKMQQLPLEMTTGHILQNLVTLQDTIDALKRELAQVKADKPEVATLSSENNSITIVKRKLQKS